jgi:hypothetical protein
MGFRNIATFIDAQETSGRSRLFSWRKVPTQTTALGIWFDLSMSPGNPVPNYYAAAPLVSKRLAQSTDGGIFHGSAVSPMVKHLTKLTAITVTTTAVPLPMILLDYLLYYPFIDMSVFGEAQPMTQGETLPRYPTGAGVQMMAVEVAAQIGGWLQQAHVHIMDEIKIPMRVDRMFGHQSAQRGSIFLPISVTNLVRCFGIDFEKPFNI